MNDFSETSEGPIFDVNFRLSNIFNGILNEKLLNEINKDIVKYKNLFKLLSSKLPVINYENLPWKTMTTRGKKKKQEEMKNSNQHKNVENIKQNETQEKLDENFSSKPLVKKPRGRPRKNLLTNLKMIPSQTKRKRGRPRKQIYENELPEINMQKESRAKVKSDSDSDSDSDPESDPEYLDYLKEIQAKNKRNKNGKKPKQFIIPQEQESENYFSTSEDEVIHIKTEDEENSENSCIEEIFENKNIEDTVNEQSSEINKSNK